MPFPCFLFHLEADVEALCQNDRAKHSGNLNPCVAQLGWLCDPNQSLCPQKVNDCIKSFKFQDLCGVYGSSYLGD